MKRGLGRTIALLAALLACAAAAIIYWQSKSTRRPSFAVASIKPNPSAEEIPGPWAETSGYFAWNGKTLRTLLMAAYRVRSWQIQGGPDWMDSELWDVEGKADPEGADVKSRSLDQNGQHAELMLMLQTLLEDRFQLKIRRQVRPSPAYKLVVASGGPKLQLDPDQSPPAGTQQGTGQPRGWMSMGSGPRGNRITGRAVTMDQFVNTIQQHSDRPVLDRTQLKGRYNFAMFWAPDNSNAAGGPESPSQISGANLPLGPAFFAALEEQLGLRLESAEAPVEFLVVTGVQKPPQN